MRWWFILSVIHILLSEAKDEDKTTKPAKAEKLPFKPSQQTLEYVVDLTVKKIAVAVRNHGKDSKKLNSRLSVSYADYDGFVPLYVKISGQDGWIGHFASMIREGKVTPTDNGYRFRISFYRLVSVYQDIWVNSTSNNHYQGTLFLNFNSPKIVIPADLILKKNECKVELHPPHTDLLSEVAVRFKNIPIGFHAKSEQEVRQSITAKRSHPVRVALKKSIEDISKSYKSTDCWDIVNQVNRYLPRKRSELLRIESAIRNSMD